MSEGPFKSLPSLEQVAKRVVEHHNDHALFVKILETHRDQIKMLTDDREMLFAQVAELNLRMAFLMTFFRFNKEGGIIDVGGKMPTENLGEVFARRREKLIEKIDAKLGGVDGEGTQEQPHDGEAQGDLLPAQDAPASDSGTDDTSRVNGAPTAALRAERGDSRITH